MNHIAIDIPETPAPYTGMPTTPQVPKEHLSVRFFKWFTLEGFDNPDNRTVFSVFYCTILRLCLLGWPALVIGLIEVVWFPIMTVPDLPDDSSLTPMQYKVQYYIGLYLLGTVGMLTQEWVSCIVGSKSATKKDLEPLATKEDLKRFATKEDLKRFATKEDLAKAMENMVTKDDLAKAMDNMLHKLMAAFTESGMVDRLQTAEQNIEKMQPSAYVDKITKEAYQEQSKFTRRNGFQLLE